MLTEVQSTKWAVKVNGVVIVDNIPSRALAESAILHLPVAQQPIAEVVQVTSDGKMVLMG